MDATYQDYINQVARLTLPATFATQLQTIQQSPKFADGEAKSFPGYSVITPPSKEDTDNQDFYSQIATLQEQLSQQLEADFLITLPPASFHLTIADLIWDDSYLQIKSENPDFDPQMRQQIAAIFQQYQQENTTDYPVMWQFWGIAIRPRAIMACLAPKDQESYQSIIKLRRSIYQDSGLIALGIEQQYDFTAHITLGYFGNIAQNLNRDRLCVTLSQFNDHLVEKQLPALTVKRAELRKFDNMINYYRESDWAAVEFDHVASS